MHMTFDDTFSSFSGLAVCPSECYSDITIRNCSSILFIPPEIIRTQAILFAAIGYFWNSALQFLLSL